MERKAAPVWSDTPGKRVTIHTLHGSYAAKRASAVLADSEQCVAELEQLLGRSRDRREPAIDIYLTDPVGYVHEQVQQVEPAQTGFEPLIDIIGDSAIVRVIEPDIPTEPLIWPLTHVLIRRWFGPRLEALPVFFDGIAGVVAGRVHAGPSVLDADDWVRAELAAQRPVSVLSGYASSAARQLSETGGAGSLAATSFIGFLVANYGHAALSTFLTAFDPERRDRAATDAYQQPLGVLEETWLAELQRRARAGSPFRAFFSYVIPLVKPYWRRESEVAIYMVVGLIYGLALPLSSKYLIDDILPGGSVRKLLVFIALLLGFYVINGVIAMRRAYVTTWINQQIYMDLQERMFTRLQRLPHDFYARAKVGDVMSRLSSDVSIVQSAISQVTGVGVFLALEALVAAIAIITLNPLLGGLVLTTVPLFAITYVALRSRLREASLERQQRSGEALTTVQENLAAQSVIKAYGMEEQAISAFHSRQTALFRAALRLNVLGALFETSMGLAVTLGQLMILGVGGYLVIDDQITLGTLLAFLAFLPSLFEPVAALAGTGQTVQVASGSLDRVNELLEEPISIADTPGAIVLPPLSREIRFEGVTFSYEANRTILSDLSFTIPAGSKVAIVGPSGSGKSTIVSLLLRFWDPLGGHISFDDHDLRTATLTSLRGQIGLVFQDTFIFDTTVRENIAISLPGTSDADVARAASSARLDDYIATLPAGFDTVLGERGVRMSGGQRQRMAIARALLRDPRILILDEATSALDAQTESEILETLERASEGRTTISITHRLSSAALADCIYVLDQGRLVEQGSHAELFAAGGLYQRLYQEQTGHAAGDSASRMRGRSARLRSIPLFADVEGAAIKALAGWLTLERYAADEMVVRQGEPGDALYLIGEGQVEVILERDGHEQRVNLLRAGDYFGEMALLTDQPRAATVRTTMPSELYSLSREDFASLIEREPQLRSAVAATVQQRQMALAAAASVATARSDES